MPHRNFSSESEIHRIGLGLIDLSLPKTEWTHAAHFAAALWLLRYRPEWDASRRMPDFIRAYNEATGVANTATSGYHETITLASLGAAAAHAEANPRAAVHELANMLLAGPCGEKDWLLEYWSRGMLFSPLARARWVDPDVAILPFSV